MSERIIEALKVIGVWVTIIGVAVALAWALKSLNKSDRVFYRTCADARAAGDAPLYRGEPGYRSKLDRDGDGVACEPWHGR